MIEVESAPVTTKKRNIVLWPSIVMLTLVCGFWVFLYDDIPRLLLCLSIHFFAAICLICFICLIVLRRLRKSLSFLIPILLAGSMGWWFIPTPAMSPISRGFSRFSRLCRIPCLQREAPHKGRGAQHQTRLQNMGPV